MGHELNGGRWALSDRSSHHPAQVRVTASDDGGARVEIHATLDDRPAHVFVDITGDGEPRLIVHTSITAPRRRTVTLAVHQDAPIRGLGMHQPGGMVSRALQRWYDPTFWPLHSFAAALPAAAGGPAGPGALVAATAAPTALHATEAGMVEAVVARTATKELAFGVVPVLAPAWGLKWGTQQATIGWSWSAAPDGAAVTAAGRRLQADVDRSTGHTPPAWLANSDDPLVEVMAVKVADRGDGIIVRLRSWAEPAGPSDPTPRRTVHLALDPEVADAGAAIAAAWLTDSCERDRSSVEVQDGVALIDIDAYLTTVRLAIRTRS